MRNNEVFEIEVSALLDGELVHGEILDVVDQLVDNPDLRSFYRQVRRLGRVLGEGGVASASGQLPPGLWQRIESSAKSDDTSASTVIDASSRFGGAQKWLMAAAAAVIIGVVGWMSSGFLPAAASSDQAVVNVRLAADAGQMTDDRFIELTTELLQADRRYHLVMEEIIAAVNEGRPELEGSMEGKAPLSDSHDGFRRAALSEIVTDESRQRVWN